MDKTDKQFLADLAVADMYSLILLLYKIDCIPEVLDHCEENTVLLAWLAIVDDACSIRLRSTCCCNAIQLFFLLGSSLAAK